MLERAELPDSLPSIFGLWSSRGGDTLWVGQLDLERPWRLERPNAWVVVDAEEGRVVNRLPMPDGFRPTRVTHDHVYGVFTDELGVTRARRYLIER